MQQIAVTLFHDGLHQSVVMDIRQRIGKLEDELKVRILALDEDKQRDLVFRLRVITLSTILKTSGGLWRRSKHNSTEILSASHQQV